MHLVCWVSLPFVSWVRKSWRRNENLKNWITHYGHEKTHKWIEDGDDQFWPECDLLKKVFKSQHYSRDSIWKLWILVINYHQKDFPNFTILAQLVTYLWLWTKFLCSEPHPHWNKNRFLWLSYNWNSHSPLLKRY